MRTQNSITEQIYIFNSVDILDLKMINWFGHAKHWLPLSTTIGFFHQIRSFFTLSQMKLVLHWHMIFSRSDMRTGIHVILEKRFLCMWFFPRIDSESNRIMKKGDWIKKNIWLERMEETMNKKITIKFEIQTCQYLMKLSEINWIFEHIRKKSKS